jgi:2-iminobutanoate/2-iminopropanoate deaminase
VVGKGDFEAQHRQCFENIKRILEAAGAKMSDIVWILWLLKDIREASNIRQFPAYKEYFGDHHPPGTCVQIFNLGVPELLLEVQVIAVIDG